MSGELTAADSIDLNGAELYSNQLGGAFGSSTNSEIYMIGVDVRVIGRTYLGGIVGQATNTKIYSSYAAGHVYGVATGQEGSPAHSSHVGGFAGYGSSLTIEDSYSVVTVEYEVRYRLWKHPFHGRDRWYYLCEFWRTCGRRGLCLKFIQQRAVLF